MSLIAETILPPRKERSWALWAIAAAIILAIHVLVAAYVLFLRQPEANGVTPSEPIIIDLAPVVAPPAAQQAQPQPETKPAPLPDPVPVPQPVEETPLPQTPDMPPDATVEATLPAQMEVPQPVEETPLPQTPDMPPDATVEATLPAQMEVPQPVETPLLTLPELPPEVKADITLPEPVKPKPVHKREAVKKAAMPTRHPRHEARPTARPDDRQRTAERSQARSAASPAASSFSMASWKGELVAHIRRFQRYPEAARSRGETGTAFVSFTLDGSGRVISARLTSSSGSSVLDQEAVATVRRASPMPAPPNRSAVTVNVPLRYSLR